MCVSLLKSFAAAGLIKSTLPPCHAPKSFAVFPKLLTGSRDAILSVWKQRKGGNLSRTKLWFCTEAKRFRTTPEPEPKMEPATTEKAEDGKELF